MSRRAVFAMPLVWLAFAGAAVAQAPSVKIDHAWSRAAMAGRNGVVYLTITAGRSGDRLIGVASPVAEKTELHESLMEQGVMKMRGVTALPIAPEQTVTLAPGGLHIMLLRLKQPLHEGDSVPVTLTFEKAGLVRPKRRLPRRARRRQQGIRTPAGLAAISGKSASGRAAARYAAALQHQGFHT